HHARPEVYASARVRPGAQPKGDTQARSAGGGEGLMAAPRRAFLRRGPAAPSSSSISATLTVRGSSYPVRVAPESPQPRQQVPWRQAGLAAVLDPRPQEVTG